MSGYAKVLAAVAICAASPAFSQTLYVTPPACGFNCSLARPSAGVGINSLWLSPDGAPWENWVVSTRSNKDSLRNASTNMTVARSNASRPLLGLSDVAMWRLDEGSNLMMIRGDLTNSGLTGARLSSVELVVTDPEGRLLRTVTVETGQAAIARGEAKPFTVQFAMDEAPAGPVRIKLGQVRPR